MTRLSLDGDGRVGFETLRGADVLGIVGDRLFLRCLRTYSFGPDEVVFIEHHGPIGYGAGVRVVHNRADYPREMSFSCRGGSDEVFALLARAGFVPRGTGPAGRSSFIPAARAFVVAAVIYAVSQVLVRLLR